MINVTKLNGKKFHLNAIYIETVDSHPDTTITLFNGKKYIVAEPEYAVVQAIQQFYRSINILGAAAGKGGIYNEE
ncbi:flagellar FlbD family protein [Peribacillus kribbensis]|uniref:flagellar FlbD family protein n=1 Tax=Peribacillus kribbensis TaxID=356658 RepID=UPI00047DCA9D|nr:flagellar FlbD family protein [Peribacillus kribbensis]